MQSEMLFGMPTPPSGEVTMLFTDIEGSTRMLEELGTAYADALDAHRRLLRKAFARHNGVEIDTQGDAFFVAFSDPLGAVTAALDAQRALARTPMRVRMGLHTGTPTLTDEGYVGIDVHRAARIAATAHGGQIVLSKSVRDLLGGDVDLRDLGEHRLKDLAEPEWLFQPLVAGLPTDFPPLKSLSATNLPMPARRLIGRDRELADVIAAMAEKRLVTITGSGGTGKTRLAVEVALEQLERFPNGVFFVGLASVSSDDMVAQALAAVLGVRERPSERLVDSLAEYLRGRRTLLLLDNFEHVIGAVGLVSAVLAEARDVHILITSREPLRLTAEHEFCLLPLETTAAVELFEERTGTAKHADPAVVELCGRLDGLPLAIELAAARAKLWSPASMLERMDLVLPMLTAGHRDLPARQQTLRATIEWSYALLNESEQRLLRRLSVFSGGGTLDAIDAVAGEDAHLLGSLVDKSLVRMTTAAARCWMLQTIREYAAERLRDTGGEADARARLAAWVEGEAQRAAPHLLGAGQLLWIGRLQQDEDNIRETVEWALEHDPGRAVRIVTLLLDYWDPMGRSREARAWLERGIAAWRPPDEAWDARAHIALSLGALLSDDLQMARQAGERAVELAEIAGDRSVRSRALTQLAGVSMAEQDFDQTGKLAERAAVLAREVSDHTLIAFALNCLAVAAFEHGDPDRAQHVFAEAVDHLRAVGDRRNMSVLTANLGVAALMNGDFAAAADSFATALHSCGEIGERGRLPSFHADLAIALTLQGKLGEARGHLAAVLADGAEPGDVDSVISALSWSAALSALCGDDRTAAVLRGSAEAAADDHQLPPGGADVLVQERVLGPAAERLGQATWDAARMRGRALTLVAATELALRAVVDIDPDSRP